MIIIKIIIFSTNLKLLGTYKKIKF